jgi:hypothetical protein
MADKDKLKRQKESIRLEKEYQQTLSFSAQVQRDLNKEINKGVDARTKHGKAVKEHNKEVMKGLGSLQSSSDISKKIVEIENQNVKLSKSKNGFKKREVNQKIKNNNFVLQGLQLDYERVAAAEQLNDVQKDVTKGIQDQVDKISEFGNNLPLVGGIFKSVFGKAFKTLKSDISDAGKEMLVKFGEGGMSLKNLTASMTQFGSSMMASLAANPMVLLGIAIAGVALIITGFISLVKRGYERFKELEAAGRSFRDTTGLLNSQTSKLVGNIQTISRDMATLGASAEDVAKAAADFSNEFGGIEQPSKAVLSSMVMLNKNFGIGTAEASKLNKVFQNIGDLSAEQAQALIGQTASMAKMAGVAPQRVIADMAESSEYAYKFFKGSPKELAKAAVQAAKMGTSIAEAGKAADNLLDFQSSISKELEASAILGVNLNLSQARYAAANGDLIGQQQAINDQVAKLGDLTKLNVFEQQALADATGMEFSSLVNQQRIRERFGKLNQEQLAAATALVDAGKDINSITDKDLQDQTSRMARQQEMQSRIEKMQNTFKALGTQISDAFAPFASTFVDIASILGSVLVPTFKVLGFIIKTAFLPITFTFQVLRNMVDTIRAIRDDGIGGLIGKLKEMGPLMSFIVGLVTTLGVIWVSTILPSVISTVVSLATGLVGALVMAIPLIVSMAIGFITSAIAAISTMSALTLGIGAIAIIGGIAAASAAANSSIDEGAGKVEGAIQDGVISPDGSIISTDPADFILATKDPSQLAQDVSGGGVGVDMSGVIAELQSLKSAFLSNKDVYMDKSLVTSAVTNTQERSGRENRFGLQGA